MTTMKNYQDIFQINVFGQIQFTQSITKNEQNGGSIVFISSTSATDAVIGRSAYSSSKMHKTITNFIQN